ncbi:hypothetical protein HPP92_003265 [Vanilla planifolia]|uniref:Uncharacterized protein n=1 Tax=Vanilla planifolia TaxID=51239 RepID=A0A835SGB8_VANPL|nr:hypothetical protein HPP92_003265 [Vanilla planifolia]
MDESNSNADLDGSVLRLNSVRAPAFLKSSLYGRSGARNSTSFRRSQSNRTPRRDSRAGSARLQWIWGNKVLFWLMLITVWAYIGFHVQSRWAHSDHQKKEFIGYENEDGSVQVQTDSAKDNDSLESRSAKFVVKAKEQTSGDQANSSDSIRSELTRNGMSKTRKNPPKKRGGRMLKKVVPKAPVVEIENPYNEQEDMVFPNRSTSFGLMVGPFGDTEDRILEWSPAKRRGTCERKGAFGRIVWSRTFILIFHELSMTGAPLSMMELATELLSCGAYVKVVVLSKKGGLMSELNRRGINILEDKGEISFKAAMKADLVVAGSAVSSSWIEQYLKRNSAGSNQIVWWIMENRKEYFIRSKAMLSQVKMLTFLSDAQSKQWLSWCEEENIKLKSQPMVVPLSVNDELAFVAGIPVP